MTYDDFKFYIGETIEYCQTIENDVKWIYAKMLRGGDGDNYNEIAEWTLGKVVNKLEELDYSDDDNLLSRSDYELLREIKDERNYICHQIFRDFMYERNFEHSNSYQKACRRLMNFHNRLKKLWQSIEKMRINMG